jgi:hypothetical protein
LRVTERGTFYLVRLPGTIFPLLVVFAVLLIAAQGIASMNKYDWLPSESAHEKYPMQIVKGDLILKDGTSIYIPDRRIVYNGWGVVGSTHIVGDKLKALPTRLNITWFSYTEDKFYAGTFVLPSDRIELLFKNGIKNPRTGRNITFQTIIVGMAPEGAVSVWLETESLVLEVATFHASEAKIDWKALLDNDRVSRKQYIDIMLKEALSPNELITLKAEGIPKGLSETHLKQYEWKPKVVGSKLLAMKLKTNNGEYETFSLLQDTNPRSNRAVPNTIYLDWQDTFGIKYTTIINFDENETFRAFQKLSSGNAGHQMELLLEISEKTHEIEISLKDHQFILRLQKTKVKVYSM